MISYMDYRISKKPIRHIDLTVDKSILKIKSLNIVHAGHIPGRTHFRRKAKFKHWAVVYIAGGSGTYQVTGGEVQRVDKGCCFLFYPGAVFHYGPGPGEHWDEHYIAMEGPRIQEWLDTWLAEPSKVRQTDETHQAKINKIFTLLESGSPDNVDRAALLLESLLLEFVLSSESAPHASKTEHTLQLVDDISESLYRPFDAKRLCEKHHISLPTLRRVISKYTGYPLNEYVHRLKMAEAKNIMLNTDASLKEIAASLGYDDVFYFSRLFKKFAGVSPNIFRRNM